MLAMSVVPTSETARATPSGPWLYAVIVSGQVSSLSCTRVRKRAAARVEEMGSRRSSTRLSTRVKSRPGGDGLRPRAEDGEAEQRGPQPVELDVGLDALEARELAVAEAVIEAGPEVEDLVDLGEVDRVVQNHLVRGVLGEDGAPEVDLRLQPRGAREEPRLACVGGGLGLRGADAAGRGQGGEQRC